jgi:hypothetical protein
MEKPFQVTREMYQAEMAAAVYERLRGFCFSMPALDSPHFSPCPGSPSIYPFPCVHSWARVTPLIPEVRNPARPILTR